MGLRKSQSQKLKFMSFIINVAFVKMMKINRLFISSAEEVELPFPLLDIRLFR